jgi:hypothetical protein
VGFLAPAIPWAIKGGAMLGGSLFGKMIQGGAQKRSPEEGMALQGAQSAAGNLTQQGNALIGQGVPMLGQAGNYWQTLLSGNRAAMAQATAGPRAALTDVYRGAESNLERSGIRGAARDVASAELGRDRAGQIARLTTGVQPGAAHALAGVGSQLLGTGAPMLGQAGGIWGNLLGAGFDNRQYARGEGEKGGKAIGGLIFDILQGTLGKKFGGGGNMGAGIPNLFQGF